MIPIGQYNRASSFLALLSRKTVGFSKPIKRNGVYRPVNRLPYHSSEAHQKLKLVVQFSLTRRRTLQLRVVWQRRQSAIELEAPLMESPTRLESGG